MGVLEAILVILALKIPIIGLICFVYWLVKEPEPEGPTERKARALPPRLPEPGDRLRSRKRGPHGGAARSLPVPRRDPHPALAQREPLPAARETQRGPTQG